MSSHLISIIIPVYNAKEKLLFAFESITSQTYKEYEIVIVDGLSHDGTPELIRNLSKSYPNVSLKIKSEKDAGIYDAMNKGLDLAVGKWVYFLGADDQLLDKDTLKDVASVLMSTDAKVVYGNVKIIGDTSWAKNAEIYDGKFDLEKLLVKNICHQSIFYNSEFIKEKIGKYNTRYSLCSDWDMNLRCFSRSKFLYIDRIVASFHGGGASTLTNQDREFSNDFIENILGYFQISLFNPLINNINFSRFHDVLLLQKKKNYIGYLLNRLKMSLS